jgi:hypothetical protein
MPDLDAALHYASVTYAAGFGSLTTNAGLVSFTTVVPVQFSFTFETGRTQPDPDLDLQEVTWDYSWFDQPAVEASIAAALDAISATLAELLSLTPAQVQESVAVQRIWTAAANEQGSAAPLQFGQTSVADGIFTIVEAMPYPAEVSGSAPSA